MTFRLDGATELKEQLDKLRASTAKAALQRAGLKALQPMADLARSLAPEKTGELAQSIAVGAQAKNDEVGRLAYRFVMGGGGTREQAVTAMRQARREEKGRRGAYYVDLYMGPRAGRSRDEVIKGIVQEFGSFRVEPHPYMRPAFEQDKDALMQRLSDEVRAEVAKAISRAAARAARRKT
ncbi:HK97-gp10 family putative phage morphogenesis protein [Rubellimicrobium mesophilum]|nr:HK97-gp10 family putative phage morphogenesis protein [Rubellimicrobium mesophilum]